MTKYILGKDLLDRWEIKPFELFHHVKGGLQPHNKFGKPISPPDIALKLNRLNDLRKESNLSIFDCLRLSPEELKSRFESCRDKDDSFKLAVLGPIIESERRKPRYEQITKDIKSLENDLAKIKNKYSWRDYELPEDTRQAEWVMNSLLNAYYKRTDVARIGKEEAKQPDENFRPTEKVFSSGPCGFTKPKKDFENEETVASIPKIPPSLDKPLIGYKEMGNFLGVKAETVEKRYKPQGAPIYYQKQGRPWALPSEFMAWKKSRSTKNRKK